MVLIHVLDLAGTSRRTTEDEPAKVANQSQERKVLSVAQKSPYLLLSPSLVANSGQAPVRMDSEEQVLLVSDDSVGKGV